MPIANRRFGDSLPPASDRYHLMVSATCPWCRRMLITWEALGLDKHLSIAWATGASDDGFTFADQVTGVSTIRELYRRDTNYDVGDPTTVPALIDLTTNEIVCRDSGTLMLDAVTAWRPFHAPDAPNLFPDVFQDEVLAAWAWVDANLSPFTHSAITGDLAAHQAFRQGLAELDSRISNSFLVGDRASLADIAAFAPIQSWLWAGNDIPRHVSTWVSNMALLSPTANRKPAK